MDQVLLAQLRQKINNMKTLLVFDIRSVSGLEIEMDEREQLSTYRIFIKLNIIKWF